MMAEEVKSQKGKPRAHRSGGKRAKGLCEREVRELESQVRASVRSGQRAAAWLALLQPRQRSVPPAPWGGETPRLARSAPGAGRRVCRFKSSLPARGAGPFSASAEASGAARARRPLREPAPARAASPAGRGGARGQPARPAEPGGRCRAGRGAKEPGREARARPGASSAPLAAARRPGPRGAEP